jgi:YggT family protein
MLHLMGPVVALLDIYSLVVLAAVVLSWVRLPESNPLVRITSALTEPLLGPIRRVLPAFGGLDFSAMILLLGLRLLRNALLT